MVTVIRVIYVIILCDVIQRLFSNLDASQICQFGNFNVFVLFTDNLIDLFSLQIVTMPKGVKGKGKSGLISDNPEVFSRTSVGHSRSRSAVQETVTEGNASSITMDVQGTTSMSQRGKRAVKRDSNVLQVGSVNNNVTVCDGKPSKKAKRSNKAGRTNGTVVQTNANELNVSTSVTQLNLPDGINLAVDANEEDFLDDEPEVESEDNDNDLSTEAGGLTEIPSVPSPQGRDADDEEVQFN